MATKQDTSKIFLKAFVTALIENSPKQKIPELTEIPEPEEIIHIPQRITVQGMPKKRERIQLPQLPKKQFPQLPQPPGPPIGKISKILRDPSVQEVECPGPNKNLLVNKSNRIQTSSLIFAKEDIDEVLNDFSEKTRIPLIQGVFKAAHGNLIITAVISEFVGSRFIIQKKIPSYH